MISFKGMPMKKTTTILICSALLVSAASAALAAGGGGHADGGMLLKDFLYRCLSFAAVVGLLFYFVNKPLRKGLAGRTEGIEKALAEARQAKVDAEAKFAEYDTKLAQATEEIESISASIRHEGEQERDRIIANAQDMAKKVSQEATQAANREVERARGELRQEAARMAIEIAEEILEKKFTKKDQVRLVNEYMDKVGELH